MPNGKKKKGHKMKDSITDFHLYGGACHRKKLLFPGGATTGSAFLFILISIF